VNNSENELPPYNIFIIYIQKKIMEIKGDNSDEEHSPEQPPTEEDRKIATIGKFMYPYLSLILIKIAIF